MSYAEYAAFMSGGIIGLAILVTYGIILGVTPIGVVWSTWRLHKHHKNFATYEEYASEIKEARKEAKSWRTAFAIEYGVLLLVLLGVVIAKTL